MSRLSRDKKRDQKHAVQPAGPAVPPIDVHVPVAGPGAGTASVGGVPVVPAPGEEIQHTILNHLHRIALAGGHPVHATIHDERIGYVVPLQMNGDGSTQFTAEPVRVGVGAVAGSGSAGESRPMGEAVPAADAVRDAVPPPPPPGPPAPPRDRSTHVLRAIPEAQPQPPRDAAPTFPLRAIPESVQDTPPGTVAPPMGEFGPPPAMDAPPPPPPAPDAQPLPPQDAQLLPPQDAQPLPPQALKDPTPLPSPAPQPLPPHHHKPQPPVDAPYTSASDVDPEAKPTPPRGFDAVAEAVLGDDPLAGAHGDEGAQLAEPVARIGEAVREGRIESAAELAAETVAEASGTLGPEHPEVLRLRELTAYVAYLAGDPVHAFGLSLDLARIRSRARDAEAAYGNVQSAATAWRAVRDPEQGLLLGRDLIGLWSELTAEDGTAAEDIEQLESARARMDRLAERARTLNS
ncbi:tetratricopeptide repeat protein [Streptomyces sp. DG2A-72]|uniref:tetratricopeptide repeat protein n=1 Tax=Streptomyces sp. DG2A-72 TaxID=3051386 RepID=UPI00265BE780|nr:tetratricopeptide repeat protein [Streptomyces sp. DG2A-72]MDO0935534.1 tetratricopeptide repeat protein [Streptomyces sp. DG2A-72]